MPQLVNSRAELDLTCSVATTQLALCWMCNAQRMGVWENSTYMHVAQTSNIGTITATGLCCCLMPVLSFARLPLGISGRNNRHHVLIISDSSGTSISKTFIPKKIVENGYVRTFCTTLTAGQSTTLKHMYNWHDFP